MIFRDGNFRNGTCSRRAGRILKSTFNQESSYIDNFASVLYDACMREKSLWQNYLYNAGYQLLLLCTPLFTSPYISRVFGAQGIGTYAYTGTVAGYFAMFAMLGIGTYGNRSCARVRGDREKLSETFCSIYSLQLATTLLTLVAYAVFALFVAREHQTIYRVRILFFLATALDIGWLFGGLEKFRMLSVRSAVCKLLSVACVFLFVKKAEDLWIYVLIIALEMLGNQLYLWLRIRGQVRFVRPSQQAVLRHLRPVLVLFLPTVVISVYSMLNKIMMGAMGGMAEVGFYEQAERAINLPMGLISVLGGVTMPRMANLVARADRQGGQALTEKSLLYVQFIAPAFAFGIAAVAPVFAPLFFGEAFAYSGTLIAALAPVVLFSTISAILQNQCLLPYQRDWAYIASLAVGAAINVVLNVLLIPGMGAMGAVIAAVATNAAICGVQAWQSRDMLAVGAHIRRGLPYLGIGLLMFAVVRRLGQLALPPIWLLLLQIGVGAVLYLALAGAVMFYTIRPKKG